MLRKRVEILYQGKIINSEVKDFTLECINIMEKNIVSYPKDVAETFITHIAMAMQRVANQEVVNKLDDEIWESITQEDCFDKANEIYGMIALNSFTEIPEGEKQFIIMHICNLLQ